MTTRAADSKTRFSSRVENYVRYRPAYPAEIPALFAREFAFAPQWNVADLGSGTGISARLFVEFGNPVFAVEPNRDMRQAAEKMLAGRPNFHSIDGSAEATTLPDHAVDLVVAAQAFHWFDPAAARRESLRILRPGGVAALMWNTRKLTGTPFLEEYEELLLRFGTDYQQFRHDDVGPAQFNEFFGGDHRTLTLPNHQHVDYDGLEGRLLSSSYIPGPGEPGYDEMLRVLKSIFARHQRDGRVSIEYETEIHWRGLHR